MIEGKPEIIAALRDFLEHAPPVLSNDGHYMRWLDGRPIVLDVVTAHDLLTRLERK